MNKQMGLDKQCRSIQVISTNARLHKGERSHIQGAVEMKILSERVDGTLYVGEVFHRTKNKSTLARRALEILVGVHYFLTFVLSRNCLCFSNFE